jgi:hypothetical protein
MLITTDSIFHIIKIFIIEYLETLRARRIVLAGAKIDAKCIAHICCQRELAKLYLITSQLDFILVKGMELNRGGASIGNNQTPVLTTE